MRVALPSVIALSALLTGCATTPPVVEQPGSPVTAVGETEPVGSANADAADDPAIWHNATNPDASLIVATDKKAGLHVYGLDGKSKSFDPAGRVNNVDLVDMGEQGVIVVASDRNDIANAKLRLYRLNTADAKLEPLSVVTGGSGEAYGVCLQRQGSFIRAFSVLKPGRVEEFLIDPAEGTARPERVLQVPSQTEGCVVDSRTGAVYIGEEDAGIWRFDKGATQGTIVARVDGKHLVADVEGLAIVEQGESGGWIVASSQGDNGFALYRLPDMAPAGRFRIVAGTLGAVEETDGIALATGNFGSRFPQGLFVAQDGHNGRQAQNFKLVSWADILTAVAAQ